MNREKNQQDLMQAHERDMATFHKLIRRQRSKPNQQINELVYNDIRHTGDLLPIWGAHFSSLAQPNPSPHFDNEHQVKCKKEIESMTYLFTQVLIENIPITVHEIMETTKKLNKKKAKDDDDLAAEHMEEDP